MGLYSNLKRGLASLVHPGAESSGKLGISKALGIYYPVAVVGLILALIVSYGYSYAYHTAPTGYFSGSYGHAILLVALYLVLMPIGIFIDAAIYHIVGKYFLNAWKGDYPKSFAAYTFGILPFVSLYWLAQVPLLKIPITLLIAVWSVVMIVIAFASQHKIRRVDAAVVVMVTFIAALVIVFLIISAVAYSTLSPLGGGLGAPMIPVG